MIVPGAPGTPTAETAGMMAALYIRYKGRATSIMVNGVDTPLIKLGHNAEQQSGWHAYVLRVEPETSYTLTFKGQISLVGQCVRVVAGDDGGVIT